MRAVNLLPKTQGIAGTLSGGRSRVLVVGAIAAVAAMGVWGVAANQSADSVASQAAQAQQRKTQLDQEIAALAPFSQQKQADAAQRAVITQLAGARIDWERLVRAVVTVLPSGVWVNAINGSLPTTSSAASSAGAGASPQANTSAPQGLHIIGDAFTQPQIADMLARLATIPGLGEPRLASSLAGVTDGKTVYAFTVDIPIDQQAQDVPTLTASGGSQGVAP
jgi:Tfp pilus assembly protein PilN